MLNLSSNARDLKGAEGPDKEYLKLYHPTLVSDDGVERRQVLSLRCRSSPALAQNGTVEMLVDQPMECMQKVAGARRLQSSGMNQTIHLSSENVHWGYF